MSSKIPDEVYNRNWRKLLNEFKSINPSGNDAKEKYEQLIEKVNGEVLTYRQRQALVARCRYSISGEYGNTKKPENLNFGKNGTENSKP
jgi:hypothetical protein